MPGIDPSKTFDALIAIIPPDQPVPADLVDAALRADGISEPEITALWQRAIAADLTLLRRIQTGTHATALPAGSFRTTHTGTYQLDFRPVNTTPNPLEPLASLLLPEHTDWESFSAVTWSDARIHVNVFGEVFLEGLSIDLIRPAADSGRAANPEIISGYTYPRKLEPGDLVGLGIHIQNDPALWQQIRTGWEAQPISGYNVPWYRFERQDGIGTFTPLSMKEIHPIESRYLVSRWRHSRSVTLLAPLKQHTAFGELKAQIEIELSDQRTVRLRPSASCLEHRVWILSNRQFVPLPRHRWTALAKLEGLNLLIDDQLYYVYLPLKSKSRLDRVLKPVTVEFKFVGQVNQPILNPNGSAPRPRPPSLFMESPTTRISKPRPAPPSAFRWFAAPHQPYAARILAARMMAKGF